MVPRTARYAAVSREWQLFFEARTFRRLVLGTDSVDEFRAIVERDNYRLGYIRRLWLRVQLPRYDCRDCDEAEDKATQTRNNIRFTKDIKCLLETLQLWDPVRHGGTGLALVLSATSPSDTDHRFQRCEIRDDYPFHYAEDLELVPGISDHHQKQPLDRLNRYFHGGDPPPLDNGHFRRLHGAPLRLQAGRKQRGRFVRAAKTLVPVPVVKELVMRRQFWRTIYVKTLSRLLDRSFIALESLRLERSISLDLKEEAMFDRGLQMCLVPSLPATLRQLSFTRWNLPVEDWELLLEESRFEVPAGAQVHEAREMAKLSFRIEHFCPPWQMDTACFLRSIIRQAESAETEQGSRLKRLILKGSLPDSDRGRQDFESLEILAAEAAGHLPQLELLELWGTCANDDDAQAFVLLYRHQGDRASLIRRRDCEREKSTAAQRRIVAKWNEVAEKHTKSSLEYEYLPIPETKADIRQSNGACVYKHLRLRDLALDPITRTILENEPYDWKRVESGNDSVNQEILTELLMDPLESDADMASLEAEIEVLDAKINAFLQGHNY